MYLSSAKTHLKKIDFPQARGAGARLAKLPDPTWKAIKSTCFRDEGRTRHHTHGQCCLAVFVAICAVFRPSLGDLEKRLSRAMCCKALFSAQTIMNQHEYIGAQSSRGSKRCAHMQGSLMCPDIFGPGMHSCPYRRDTARSRPR